MGEAPAPGTLLLGRYEVEAVLGRGGMGVVVRARHVELDESVAIKLLDDSVAEREDVLARFLREAKAAARLKNDHVVRVSDVGRLDEGTPYMVMELLDGQDLAELVRDSGRLSPALAANLVIQACEALAEAHANGIVHRDIKPSNLFITTRADVPHLKVLDFGIAKVATDLDHSLTNTGSMLGTPSYMSPEQLRSSRTVDHRTDVWGLGAVLYELLEGRRAFDGESFGELCIKIGTEDPEPLVQTPPALAAIVLRCLSRNADARFQSAFELASALAPFAADPERAAREIERMPRTSRTSFSSSPSLPQAVSVAPTLVEPSRSKRRWIAVGAGLLVGGAIALALAIGWRGRDSTAAAPAAPPPAAAIAPSPPPPNPKIAQPEPARPAPPPIANPEPEPAPPPDPVSAKKPPRKLSPQKTVPRVEPPPPTPPPVKPPSKDCDPYGDRRGC